MQGVLEYQGRVRLCSLPWEISEHLAQFRGNWLEFVPKANAITFREEQPLGCPPLTGVACELITLINSIPSEFREAMPGGELELSDSNGPVLRLVVTQGEVRIKWPRKTCYQSVPVSFESLLKKAEPRLMRITGWVRFAGSPAKGMELKALVDRFGGLYPEEDMPSECRQSMAYIRFREANLDPQELIVTLLELAEPRESLQANLEVGTGPHGPMEEEYKIQIVDGRAETIKLTLQP